MAIAVDKDATQTIAFRIFQVIRIMLLIAGILFVLLLAYASHPVSSFSADNSYITCTSQKYYGQTYLILNDRQESLDEMYDRTVNHLIVGMRPTGGQLTNYEATDARMVCAYGNPNSARNPKYPDPKIQNFEYTPVFNDNVGYIWSWLALTALGLVIIYGINVILRRTLYYIATGIFRGS